MSLDIELLGDCRETVCPTCGHVKRTKEPEALFTGNITHNLAKMAKQAEIYDCLRGAEENGFKQAKQLIEPLEKGIARMESDPGIFKAHNSPNGWGTYDQFVSWLKTLLVACKTYPDATVSVWV